MDKFRYRRYIQARQGTRWATPDEIRRSGTRILTQEENCPAAGLPLLSDGIEAWVDDSDTHSMIFGTTGSKKTRMFCMPMLGMFIKAGESFITTDPKGELYQRSAGLAKEQGYRTIVLDFRNVGRGDMWNPLSLPYELYHSGQQEAAVSRLNDFVRTLAEPQLASTQDPFWAEMASSYALANLMLLMECGDKSEVNVISLSRLCSMDVEDKLREISAQMSVYSIAGMNYKGVLTAAEKTRQSIYVTLYGMLRVFNTQRQLAGMLSDSSFDIADIGREKTAVYIIVPDEKTTLHFLATTFIKQAYEILVTEAQQQPGGQLRRRVNFLLDEFCNMPKIPDIPSMISAARSRNMRFFLVAQSLHQLRGRYGEDADTIKGNCENWVFLASRELDLLREISELCGASITADGSERPLISISELQRLSKEKGEALILHGRLYPFISEMPDIDSYEAFAVRSFPGKEEVTQPKYKIFSVDAFYNRLLDGSVPIPFPKQEDE